MNICLIGMSGSGKTTIGTEIAHKLKYKFVEIDFLVLKQTGLKNVQQVYKTDSFLWRESELEVSRYISKKDKQVISAGGGMIENKLNFDYFKHREHGCFFVYLKPDLENLVEVIIQRNNIQNHEIQAKTKKKIQKLYINRDDEYSALANLTVNSLSKPLMQNVDVIIHEFQEFLSNV